MPIIRQISLPDRLAVILGRLVHPTLRGVRVGVLERARADPAPEQVFTLIGTLAGGGMFQVADVVGQVGGPFSGVVGEGFVPL